MTSITSPIPQPRAVPFLGNSLLIDQDVPLRSFFLLAQQYGEIFQLAMPGGRLMIHCTTYALVKQLSDDKRFKKPISRNLQQIKPLVGDGLFTAELEDPSWGIARELLFVNVVEARR
jgi:cytochrome P450/NADPH-cytochrome P450 reductase